MSSGKAEKKAYFRGERRKREGEQVQTTLDPTHSNNWAQEKRILLGIKRQKYSQIRHLESQTAYNSWGIREEQAKAYYDS